MPVYMYTPVTSVTVRVLELQVPELLEWWRGLVSITPSTPHGGRSYCCRHPFQPMHRICINTQVLRAYLKSLLKYFQSKLIKNE